MAHIKAEGHLAGNDVAGAWLDGELANSGDHAIPGAGQRLDRQHELGRGAERIVAEGHGHGAGMARQAVKATRQAALAGNRGNHAHGQAPRFEHRPLLNMDLAIAQQVRAAAPIAGQRRGVAPELAGWPRPG